MKLTKFVTSGKFRCGGVWGGSAALTSSGSASTSGCGLRVPRTSSLATHLETTSSSRSAPLCIVSIFSSPTTLPTTCILRAISPVCRLGRRSESTFFHRSDAVTLQLIRSPLESDPRPLSRGHGAQQVCVAQSAAAEWLRILSGAMLLHSDDLLPSVLRIWSHDLGGMGRRASGHETLQQGAHRK